MPIHHPLAIRDLTQYEFDQRDEVVMRHAYAAQNELGRLCDERVYENDLALRLKASGCAVHTQVPVVVSHDGFVKTYRLDLVCDDAVYEGKTVSQFSGSHDAQVLNYAMLIDVRHIKLINFRPPRVKGRLLFNALTQDERHVFKIDDAKWRPLSSRCHELRQRLQDLLNDWGVFLDARLYDESLVYFFGGESNCLNRTPLTRDTQDIGTHLVHLHGPEHFFIVTAMSRDTASYHQHLQKLLRLTRLRGVQWINLSRHVVQLTTVS